MHSAFSAYLHFLRVAYLTLTEKNSRGVFASRAPAHFAGRTIFACICTHIAAPILVAIALTGGIRGLSETAVLASFIVPLIPVLVWEVIYVERSPALAGLWERLSAEPAPVQLRRATRVSWFVWGSFAAFLVSMAALIARAILEHRAGAP